MKHMTRAQRGNWNAFCSEPLELVENYQQAKADNFAGWCIHHRLEIQPDGTRMSRQELKDKNLYYGRPASELVFMRRGEHTTLHWLGKHHSVETHQKMSESHKGKHHSEEIRKKIAESKKGKHHSAEARKKISECRIGKHYPKLSEVKKGLHLHWYNNGVKSILAKTCPEGFVPGRIK